jgi:hypothetical protein
VDERDAVEEYLSPSDFNRNRRRIKENGAFIISVIRRGGRTYQYPPVPLMIPFKRDLGSESRFSRGAVP